LRKRIQTLLVYCILFDFKDKVRLYEYFRLRKFHLDNSSLSLNQTNIGLSKSSTSLLLFLLLFITLCGICYFCKNKSNNESIKHVNRSSEESQYSQETLEDEEVIIE
jgi:hypothetical protein